MREIERAGEEGKEGMKEKKRGGGSKTYYYVFRYTKNSIDEQYN